MGNCLVNVRWEDTHFILALWLWLSEEEKERMMLCPAQAAMFSEQAGFCKEECIKAQVSQVLNN